MKKVLKISIVIGWIILTAVSVASFIILKNSEPQHKVIKTNEYVLETNIKYGNYSRNYLDLCLPNNKTGKVGLILCIHGGAWVAGDKSCYEENLIDWAKKGYASASINYRYISKDVTASDIMDDITKSLIKIKSTASNYSIKIEKMLITGGSAGAHLSLLYAYSKDDIAPIKPVAVASYSGPTDLTDENFYNEDFKYKKNVLKWFSYLTGVNITESNKNEMKPLLNQVSPLNYVNASTVPTLIFHGFKDEIVPCTNAMSLTTKLSQFNVTNQFILFENSNHGLESDPAKSAIANQLFNKYVETYLN